MKKILSIATFNLGLLKLKLFRINIIPTPFVSKRLRLLPNFLKKLNVDVIALQEIYSQQHKRYLISQLKNIYPHHAYSKKRSLLGLQNGLMFLSKIPIKKSKEITYKRNPLFEGLATKKGVLSITLKNIILYNTHLTYGGILGPTNKVIEKIRGKQIKQLISSIKDKKSSIILGDFNTGPHVSKENYNLLLKSNLLNTYDEICKKDHKKPKITWDPNNTLNKNSLFKKEPPQRIDHILISKNSLFEIINSKIFAKKTIVPITKNKKITLSDHYGVLTKFKIKTF